MIVNYVDVDGNMILFFKIYIEGVDGIVVEVGGVYSVNVVLIDGYILMGDVI